MSNVIPFPGKRKRPKYADGGQVSSGKPVMLEEGEEIVRSPVQLFQFSENGTVDLAEGITVTDAVQALWDTLQQIVYDAWAEHPLGRERARVLLLTRYLDKVRPNWREELAWSGV